MPILYVLSGPDLGLSREVGDGAVLGRGGDCEVVLHASSVSRRHAQLEQDGGQWFIRDLGSRNGVFLEDERTARIELWDGAVFRLGDLELRFRAAAPEQATAEAPAVTPRVEEPEPEEESEIVFEDDAFEQSAADLVGGVEIELENEESLDLAPPPTAAPAPSSPAAPTRPAEPKQRPSHAAEERRATAMERAGIRASATGSAGSAGAAAKVHDGGRTILKFSHEPDRQGFFAADLGQYPAWVRLAAGALALAFFAGVFWLAYMGIGSLKGGPSGG